MSNNDNTGLFVGISITGLAIGFIIILSVGTILAKPLWLRYEHEVNASSHQYTEARIDEVQFLVDDWTALNTRYLTVRDQEPEIAQSIQMQMSIIENRIEHACERIPNHEVSDQARRIINQY